MDDLARDLLNVVRVLVAEEIERSKEDVLS